MECPRTEVFSLHCVMAPKPSLYAITTIMWMEEGMEGGEPMEREREYQRAILDP